MKLNQNGSSKSLLGPLLIAVILLIASLAFGVWAFSGRQTYKTKTDQLVQTAVSSANQKQQTTDAKQYALDAEKPLTTYYGPEAYGSLIINYPKTWSSYVNTASTSSNPVDGYLFPGTLPSVNDNDSTNFALRVQVSGVPYSQIMSQYAGLEQAGQTTAHAYALPKVPNVVGVELTGQMLNQKTGTLVVLPLRDQSLLIWTEGSQYLNDFNNNVLPNFSFSP
ncbi:MAG TPA: hypothetical protein VIH90_04810 [Candidatus Saccharimonadales bacterium]